MKNFLTGFEKRAADVINLDGSQYRHLGSASLEQEKKFPPHKKKLTVRQRIGDMTGFRPSRKAHDLLRKMEAKGDLRRHTERVFNGTIEHSQIKGHKVKRWKELKRIANATNMRTGATAAGVGIAALTGGAVLLDHLGKPKFKEGFNPKTPGIVAKVRHNFRDKDIFATHNEDGTPNGEFFSMTPHNGGKYYTLDEHDKRTNRRLLADKDFQKAFEDFKKHKR
jgi:hypothetical protein